MAKLKKPLYDVELIATGNELLFGRLVNTNSAWIAHQVTEAGGRMKRITCVSDDVQDIMVTVQESLLRKPDLIITTGGLGPSYDDRTLDALAQALQKKNILDKRALKMIETRFDIFSRKRGTSKKLPLRLRKMAFIVEGSEPLENVVGLAPGLKLRFKKTLIISLPGVPNEMKSIFKREVSPLIRKATGLRSLARSVRVQADMGALPSIMQEILKTNPNIYLKAYAGDINGGGIKMDILVNGETKDAVKRSLDTITEELKKLVEKSGGHVVLIE